MTVWRINDSYLQEWLI